MAVMKVAIIVFPKLKALGITYMLPMGIYEIGLGPWVLIKGLKAPSPQTYETKTHHQRHR